MKLSLASALVLFAAPLAVFAGGDMSDSFYALKTKTLQGKPADLSQYKGKVTLVVNVASQCGFTPQYTGLEKLSQDMKGKPFEILGFPSNDFGAQEPGSAEEIGAFCEVNYGVTFPMFAKIDVNGTAAHPLYNFLKGEKAGILGTRNIKWNFTKFLVSRDGKVVGRFAPTTKPQDIQSAIAAVL